MTGIVHEEIWASWVGPSYATDLEPAELKRRVCQACLTAWANVECMVCRKDYCTDCGAAVHANRNSLAFSESDSIATHEIQPVPCNVCQECRVQDMNFFCIDCGRYQCDKCCVAIHLSSPSAGNHVYVCVEGAANELYRFGIWSESMVEYTKMCRRRRQKALDGSSVTVVKQEAGAYPDDPPLSPGAQDDDETDMLDCRASSEVDGAEAMQVKMEHVRLADDDTNAVPNQALAETNNSDGQDPSMAGPDAVSVKEELAANTENRTTTDASSYDTVDSAAGGHAAVDPGVSVKQEPLRAQRHTQRHHLAADVVDLTGDDDNDDDDSSGGSRIKAEEQSASGVEPVVKTESAWLAAAFSGAPSNDGLLSALVDEDPFLSSMIAEYNAQSEAVFNTEQEYARAASQQAQLVARTSADNVQEILCSRREHSHLKNTLVKQKHSRDAVVARLMVIMKPDVDDLEELLQTSTEDIPDAQAAIHRTCAQIEASIQAKKFQLRTLKLNMDEAITMKSTNAFAEIKHLGAKIATTEDSIRQLDKHRLDELAKLCLFSQAIRSAARAIMATAQ